MTSPRFRAALDTIPAYKAGQPPSAGAQASYKLSSNENPYPPLPGVLEEVAAAAGQMNRYPDMGVSALHAAIAAKLGVSVDQVASGAGSVAVLYHLLQAMCAEGDEVVYAWRSFEAYPIAVGLTGATGSRCRSTPPRATTCRRWRPLSPPRPRSSSSVRRTTRPGRRCTATSCWRWSRQFRGTSSWSIDEAYREFVTDPDTVDGLEIARGRDNVVVLRTFSKAYGLAGLRVGYAVGPAPVAEAIRKCALPFGVSHVAQAAAVASLAAEDELAARVEELVAERERVHAALLEQGWEIPRPRATSSGSAWARPLSTSPDSAAGRPERAPVRRRRRAGDDR